MLKWIHFRSILKMCRVEKGFREQASGNVSE